MRSEYPMKIYSVTLFFDDELCAFVGFLVRMPIRATVITGVFAAFKEAEADGELSPSHMITKALLS